MYMFYFNVDLVSGARKLFDSDAQCFGFLGENYVRY